MTKEQIDAIRSRLAAADPQYWSHDGSCFGECCSTEAERQVAMHALTDLRALLAEVDRLQADPLPAAAWVREVESAAFRRGAEAMREVAANIFDAPASALGREVLLAYADAIRALPIPEDKS